MICIAYTGYEAGHLCG